MDQKMFYCKLLLVFLLISSTFPVKHAVKMEQLIGGYAAAESNFKYQAAIIGKYNYSTAHYLLCSAGIINDYFLITAARCFIHKLLDVKKLTFFAVVNTDMLLSRDISLTNISEFYTFHYNGFGNDLAIAKLAKSLNLENSTYLAPLSIPFPNETFHGQIGVVAGYGIDTYDELVSHGKRERLRVAFKYGLKLRYANVTIINDGPLRHFVGSSQGSSGGSICGDLINNFIEICGLILPDERFIHRGVCLGDNGAPLVVDNKVVGIVSRRNVNCDDTVDGTAYTKVSNLQPFIDSVLQGRPQEGTTVYTNLGHISLPKHYFPEI